MILFVLLNNINRSMNDITKKYNYTIQLVYINVTPIMIINYHE